VEGVHSPVLLFFYPTEVGYTAVSVFEKVACSLTLSILNTFQPLSSPSPFPLPLASFSHCTKSTYDSAKTSSQNQTPRVFLLELF